MSTVTSNQTISEKAKSNIDEIEQELETSSAYFNPQPGTIYVIKINAQNDKILPVQNDRFKDPRVNRSYDMNVKLLM